MPVSAGREFLSIPGPAVIPDAVLAAMLKPAVDIYAGPLVALTDGLLSDMSRVFNTAGPRTARLFGSRTWATSTRP